MSDYDRPTGQSQPEPTRTGEPEITRQTGGPVGTYERPERTSSGLLVGIVVLVVLALLVFLLVQFVL